MSPSRNKYREARRRKEFIGSALAVEPAALPPAPPVHSEPLPDLDPNVSMSGRVLVALRLWHERHGRFVWAGDRDLGGATTPDLAARLDIKPGSASRNHLNNVLTALRKKALLHYEFDRSRDTEVRWWLTEHGYDESVKLGHVEVARRLN